MARRLLWIPVVLHLALCGIVGYQQEGLDFGKMYFATRDGKLYALNPASTEVRVEGRVVHHRNLNPPQMFLLVEPLAAWPIEVAWPVWVSLQVLVSAMLVRWVFLRRFGSGSPPAP